MPDLKRTADEALADFEREVAEWRKRALAELSDRTFAAIQGVKDVAQVRKAMESDSTADIIQRSALALVSEVAFDPAWSQGGAAINGLSMRTSSGDQWLKVPENTRVPPGRYRALFFLLPVEEK